MNKKEIMGLCEFLKLHGYENADNISKFIFELQQENKLLNKKYLDAVTDYEQTMSENKQLKEDIKNITKILDKNCDDLETTEEEFESLDRWQK